MSKTLFKSQITLFRSQMKEVLLTLSLWQRAVIPAAAEGTDLYLTADIWRAVSELRQRFNPTNNLISTSFAAHTMLFSLEMSVLSLCLPGTGMVEDISAAFPPGCPGRSLPGAGASLWLCPRF